MPGWPARGQRKYANEPVSVDGIRFDSRAEYRRYVALRILADAGAITALTVHPRWDLHALGGARVSRYTADFSYRRDGALVVEDVKSPVTRKEASYRTRCRWMKAEYGITITEVV